MIVKKVPTSKRAPAKSKAANVRGLADYIVGPNAGGADEKVEHRGALNLLNLDHGGQVQEMIDLAEMAKRSPQPVQHWIMSWREGEQPTLSQADEAVRVFLREMGLSEHQALYGLHRDTDNWHLHLAVNRVHPESETIVTVNGRFDHEIAHRAIARIERAQGWQSEDRALYQARQDGQLERAHPRHERERKPSVPARDFEERVGQRSAERIAVEDGAQIIRESRSWPEVHQGLAHIGIRFERKGSGAILWVGEAPVKASSAGRDCSMAALQKRLGIFAPDVDAPKRLAATERTPEPIAPKAPAWADYIQARHHHYNVRDKRREDTRERQRDDYRRMVERHRDERADLSRGSWRGRGEILNALRSTLAARQAQDKAELRDRQMLERTALRQERERFPGYEEWLNRVDRDLAQDWRHRERQPATIEGLMFRRPAPRDIRAFIAVVEGGRVHYHRAAEPSSPAFTDRGKEIDIHDSKRRESVLAALQLSAQKWGTFTVHGNEHFRRTCVALAAEHGFKIENPELQQAIAVERERLRLAREAGPPGRSERTHPDSMTPAAIYRRHLDVIIREQPARRADPSRLDAEVAVRMAVTGHSREGIAEAINEGARADRPDENRDWNLYAQRAAGFAFSPPGREMRIELERQEQRLIRIEGREGEIEFLRRLGGPMR